MSQQDKSQAATTNVEQLLGDLDGGVFAQKIAAALSDTALGVVHTGKVGKVIVSFDFKQIGESNQVAVAHTLKYVRPTQRGKVTEENTTATPLHVGGRGKLTLFPDTQQPLFGDDKRREDVRAD